MLMWSWPTRQSQAAVSSRPPVSPRVRWCRGWAADSSVTPSSDGSLLLRRARHRHTSTPSRSTTTSIWCCLPGESTGAATTVATPTCGGSTHSRLRPGATSRWQKSSRTTMRRRRPLMASRCRVHAARLCAEEPSGGPIGSGQSCRRGMATTMATTGSRCCSEGSLLRRRAAAPRRAAAASRRT